LLDKIHVLYIILDRTILIEDKSQKRILYIY